MDDDEAVREAAVTLLTSLGYEVLVASSGPEALETLARVDDIDVLFTDVVMPGGMDGGEVARKAMLLRPGIRYCSLQATSKQRLYARATSRRARIFW